MKNKKWNNILIIVMFLVVFAFAYFLFMRKDNKTSYQLKEEEMLEKATTYVKNSNLIVNNEIYLSVNYLGITLDNNCSITSGVIYNGTNYFPYLVCDDYKSKVIVDNKKVKDYITLKGDEVVVLPKKMNFVEPGYNSNTGVDIIGDIGTEEGVYNLYYTPQNSNYFAIRKVIVVDDDKVRNLYPQISLNGEEIEYVVENNDYIDKGASATDYYDGNISNKVVIENNVNTSIVGEYFVNYIATNSKGYSNSIKRQVNVISKDSELEIGYTINPNNLTKENVLIKLMPSSDNYQKVIFPDGTENNILEYEVEENGIYKFTFYDEYNRMVEKEIVVDNIDKTVPTGTCKASLSFNKTQINTIITSSNKISGYNYYINEKDSGFLLSSTYTNSSIKDVKSVYVIVKDYIGNENKIVCNMENLSSFDPNGIRTIISGKPRLHIPISEALSKKGYTVNDLNQCIYNRVVEAGPYTRYGVVAAAYGLIDCTYKMTGYVLPYNHTSGKVEGTYCKYNSDICGKLGINTRWGSPGGSCTTDNCWHGLNCATFVRWAMCNGGMDLCSKGEASAHAMTSVDYFPEADGVSIEGNKVKYYSGKDLSNNSVDTLLRMIKPGDAIANNDAGGHTFIVVGIDNEGIYTAEDGYFMRKIKFSEIKSDGIRYRILYLDNYYANPKNRNNLYK